MALRLEKAFGVSMDLLLKIQAGYDAAQARMHGDQIKVKRFKPDNARNRGQRTISSLADRRR